MHKLGTNYPTMKLITILKGVPSDYFQGFCPNLTMTMYGRLCVPFLGPTPTNQPACLPTWLPMQRWKTITLASVDANTPTTEISSPVPMYCYRCYTRISPENCLHLNEWPFWGWIFPFSSCTTSIKYRPMEKWRSILLSVLNPYITYMLLTQQRYQEWYI